MPHFLLIVSVFLIQITSFAASHGKPQQPNQTHNTEVFIDPLARSMVEISINQHFEKTLAESQKKNRRNIYREKQEKIIQFRPEATAIDPALEEITRVFEAKEGGEGKIIQGSLLLNEIVQVHEHPLLDQTTRIRAYEEIAYRALEGRKELKKLGKISISPQEAWDTIEVLKKEKNVSPSVLYLIKRFFVDGRVYCSIIGGTVGSTFFLGGSIGAFIGKCENMLGVKSALFSPSAQYDSGIAPILGTLETGYIEFNSNLHQNLISEVGTAAVGLGMTSINSVLNAETKDESFEGHGVAFATGAVVSVNTTRIQRPLHLMRINKKRNYRKIRAILGLYLQ